MSCYEYCTKTRQERCQTGYRRSFYTLFYIRNLYKIYSLTAFIASYFNSSIPFSSRMRTDYLRRLSMYIGGGVLLVIVIILLIILLL